MEIKEILDGDDDQLKRALFAFTIDDPVEKVVFKFNIWARHFFPQYFSSPDAPFHRNIDINNFLVYKGATKSFVNIAFRGAAKTVRTKLFFAFCICNDLDHFRRFYKILSKKDTNSKQIVTDIYNMLVGVKAMYPEIFEKSEVKREETMSSFTTSTKIKIKAVTVGTDQRGDVQEEVRPDILWYEDFENRETLMSARKTLTIWNNMEEARTGLAHTGACIYTCNYISEQGNVHKLVAKESEGKTVLIVPIEDENKNPTWERFSKSDIDYMRDNDDDFEGERLCKPSASRDILFDRESIDKMEVRIPLRETAGFKIYREYDPSHRYAGGGDVGGGIGLDSSTTVFIDFDTIPAQVVGVFHSNTIKPEVFGDEFYREAEIFGGCLVAPERNYGTEAILRLKQLKANLFAMPGKDSRIEQNEPTEFGWHTNALTKPKMLFALEKAIRDGLIALNDKDLINEARSYTRNDLLENEKDPRLVTRHFDILTACAIAWQMKDHAKAKQSATPLQLTFKVDKWGRSRIV